MAQFIPGLRLSRLFFEQAVRPILQRAAPDLRYSAALIGSGSEVLGFDDEMSSDHHWGPRVMLFFRDEDEPRYRDIIHAAMRDQLPREIGGYPTNFTEPDPDDNNTQLLEPVSDGPVNHRVEVFTIRGYLLAYLNFGIGDEIGPADWLTFPEQKLLTLTAGEVFHDEAGLGAVRERFGYYPKDVWLYMLAAGWSRISQEEHLMGRAGLAGSELGSALIGARLVRDIMRLCFLMERKYAPYPKWLGTAFRRLACAERLTPHLEAAQASTNWRERESHLVPAYEAVAEMHNDLGITDPLPAKCGQFFGRPFRVIEQTGRFSKAILEQIGDPEVQRIAKKTLVGNIDQFSDSVDLLLDPQARLYLRAFYE